MIQIQKPTVLFDKTIGKQKPTSDMEYRLLAYSLVHPVNHGSIIFNSLTCELLFLDTTEVSEIYNLSYLREHWFVVPCSFDDQKFAKQYRGIYELIATKPSVISNYTILTTTDCNARCFYCYEKGRARIPMSLSTADKLSAYIIDNYNHDTRDNRQVKLNWFGGEPLLNNAIITYVCNNLKDNNLKFISTMISNGFLFDHNLVAQAKNIWNLKEVQITLDGTEKVYNRAKAYVYKNINAFQRVLDNIELLLRSSIYVKVRLNIDLYNADDLMLLSESLFTRYGHCKGFCCYAYPLFDISDEPSRVRTQENRKNLYAKLLQLDNLLESRGLKRYGFVPNTLPLSHCMVDNGSSVVVTPSGGIGLCEHFSDSEFFTSLDDLSNIDNTVITRLRKKCSDLELCKDCAYYPHCTRLVKCVEANICFEELKQKRINILRKQMMSTYHRWLQKQSDVSPVEISDNDDVQSTNDNFC